LEIRSNAPATRPASAQPAAPHRHLERWKAWLLPIAVSMAIVG